MKEASGVADAVSGLVVVATLTHWLPPIAAMLTILWTLTRLYDWVEDRLARRKPK